MRILVLSSLASLAVGLQLRAALWGASQASPARASHLRLSALPPGWKEVTESESGKTYYYNAASGVTQWQKPAAERFSGEGGSSARLLSPESLWRVKLDLTAPGSKASTSITATLRFSEEEGYE